MPDEVFQPPSKLLPILNKHFHVRPLEKGVSIPPTLEINLVDLSSIPLRLRTAVPLVFSPRLAKARIDATAFEEVYADTLQFKAGDGIKASSYPVLLLAVGGDVAEIRKAKREELALHSIALLGTDDIDRLVRPASHYNEVVEALASALRRDLSLKALHPYTPRHPVVAGEFFGRGVLLRQLTVGQQLGSAVVLGNRRMGKTSLLRELQRRMDKAGVRTSFLSGLNKYLPHKAAPLIAEELLGGFLPPRAVADMEMDELPERIAKVSAQNGLRFAIFYDEVDKLIAHDERDAWPVLGALKVINDQHGEYCRVFLAGFRHTMTKFNDDRDNNPLANFGERVTVGRLERHERKDMIERPLRLMGLDIPTDLHNAIDRLTVGMPELIQICCRGLVNWFQESRMLPEVDAFEEWIFNDEDYRGAVRYTFIRNTNPFERLVTLLLIDDARSRHVRLEGYWFEVDKVRELIRRRDPRVRPAVQLEDTMRALSTASIIEKGTRPNEYRFSLPSLDRFYAGDNRIEAAIKEAMDEIEAHTEIGAWLEPADEEPARGEEW